MRPTMPTLLPPDLEGATRGKLLAPRLRPELVARRRLTDRLDALAPGSVAVVVAPAGFGKTTLAASWLASRPANASAWLSLGPEEQDGARFVRALAAAFAQRAGSIGRASLLGQVGACPQPPREAAALLAEEVELHLHEPLTLVLDDYHEASNADNDAALGALVANLRERVRVVVLTRHTPQLPLARWRAGGRLLEIDERDLRFLPEESCAFMRGTMKLQVDEATLGLIDEHVEGWAAGLQLAALCLRDEPSPQRLARAAASFDGRHRFVADYLAAEVLAARSPQIRHFLRCAAVLECFNRALGEFVSGIDDCSAILCELERAHMFLVPLDERRQWFRFHTLFAEFLAGELGEAELRHVHRQASDWYEREGALDSALHHAARAGDGERSVRLLRAYVDTLMRRGEIRTMLRLIEGIAPDALAAAPDLSLLRDWALYLVGRTGEAGAVRAAPRAPGAAADDATRGRTLALESYFALNWGDAAQVPALAEEALRLLDRHSVYFRGLTLSYLGQAQAVLGQRVAAVASLRQAYEFGSAAGALPTALGLMPTLAWLLREQGRLDDGIALCQAAIDASRDGQGAPLGWSGPAHTALGMLQFEGNDVEGALHSLTVAEHLTEQNAVLWFQLTALCELARVRHAAGDPAGAWKTVERALGLLDRGDGPRRRSFVDRIVIDLRLAEGDVEAAADLLAEHHRRTGRPSESDELRQVRLFLAQRRWNEALALATRIEAKARAEGFDGSRVRALVLVALARWADGRKAGAQQALAQALAVARPRRLARAFVDSAAGLAPLFAEAPTDSATAAQALGLDCTVAPARAVFHLVEPLTERDIGLLQLLGQGLQNREIAEALSLTLGTTKQYVNRLFGKLGVRNRVEAVVAGRELRLIR